MQLTITDAGYLMIDSVTVRLWNRYLDHYYHMERPEIDALLAAYYLCAELREGMREGAV